MSDTMTPALDTSDMKAIHRIFREALANAPVFIGSTPDGDTERSALVGSYYDNVLRMLHGHHEGEDELLWPKLLERCPDQAQMVSRVAGQHHDVVDLLPAAEDAVSVWASSAGSADAKEALSALSALGTSLILHLDEEETFVLPLCAQYITPMEWGELPQHGMRTFSGDKPWLIMGLVREQMTAEQLARMDGVMPPPVVQMWANFGQGAFSAFTAPLRAPLEA